MLSDKIEDADLQAYDGKVHLCTTLKGQGTYHCQEDLKNIGRLNHIEDWAMSILGELYQNSERLPGKPGGVIRLPLNPLPLPTGEENSRMRTPGYSAAPVGPIVVPGQENKGPIEGLTTISPMPEEQGPTLIFNEAENASGNISVDETRAKHIFRDSEGHFPDTHSNRLLLENVANDPSAVLGTDKYGTTWAAKINPDGTQTWVGIRDGKVSYGGLNQTPKSFNPQTGLSSPTRPGN